MHAAPADTVVAYPGVYLGAGSFGSRIEAQRETARAYAARKGLTIVGEFSDEGSVPSLLAADRVRRRHLPLCVITDMLDSAPAVASVVVTGATSPLALLFVLVARLSRKLYWYVMRASATALVTVTIRGEPGPNCRRRRWKSRSWRRSASVSAHR